MGTPPRLDLPDGWHHVMNRGARHADLFLDDGCCVAFFNLLADLQPRFGVEVHGYALMPNHFHLLLRCPRAGLGTAMQYLQARYARWLNAGHDWDGPVLRGRYCNRLVLDDAYRAHLLAYLHLNPVAAGLVHTADEGRWTSHRAYVGLEKPQPWLHRGALLGLFGSAEALARYVWEVHVGRQPGPASFKAERLWGGPITGAEPVPAPAPVVRSGWPLEEPEAWARLTAVTGQDQEALARVPRGRGDHNPARDVALWFLPAALGLSQAAVARRLGVDTATVSRAASRARRRAHDDPAVEGWMAQLSTAFPGGEGGEAAARLT